MEELIAELGAAFLCARCGVDHVSHAAGYMASWIHALQSDSRFILTAARLAMAAADYLAPEVSKPANIESPDEVVSLA